MINRFALAVTAFILPAAAFAATDPSATIKPPSGAALIGQYAAKGAQIYTCVAREDTLAWGPAEPDAELDGADGQRFARHFKGPTWESTDGTTVVGSVVAKAQSPQPGAVPWLLLSAKTTGAGSLAGTRYVVRRDTMGGAEPSGPCQSVGVKVRVPYTATYAFYK